MISFRVFVAASTFMLSLGVAGLQFSPSSGNEQPQVLPKNRFSMTISGPNQVTKFGTPIMVKVTQECFRSRGHDGCWAARRASK
jgi:hypothetical protein